MLCSELLLLFAALIIGASDSASSLPVKAEIFVNYDNGNVNNTAKGCSGDINLPYMGSKQVKKDTLQMNSNSSVQFAVTSDSEIKFCPQTWMYRLNGTCHCGSSIHGTVNCVYNQVSILKCNCMTYEEELGTAVVGTCPYGCGFSLSVISRHPWSERVYSPLPSNISRLNDTMCGRLNRDGRMCGKCKKDFSPLVYTYDFDCIRCPNSKYNNWFKFFAIAFIPLTVFYFIVILFRINATNPYLYGFVTLNQAIGSPINMRSILIGLKGKFKLATRLIAIPYTLWNLDYFRSLPLNICLDLTTLQTLALDFAIAIDPLLLVLITYIVIELHARGCKVLVWLWRPFHGCCVRFSRVMDIQSSIIKAFATFLLLSYVKLLNATIDILLPVRTNDMHHEVIGWYVYYDASYEYFSKEHLPYAIIGVILFLLFILSPLLLLLFYPTSCCQRCLSSCKLRSHALQTFIDTFQGHYKDGTELGTRDCRWFAGIYFLGRIIIFYVMFGYSENSICYAMTGITLIFLGMLMILLQPFKSSKVNTYHTIIVLSVAVACCSVTMMNLAEIYARNTIPLPVAIIQIFSIAPTVVAIANVGYFIAKRGFRMFNMAH